MSQAGTADIIRLPRLWANSKEMKTDTYSDRCSTTCRNDSTMSSKWTGNRNGHRLQHDGNSCLQSGVSGRQQDEVSHRGNPPHSNAYVHRTTAPPSSRHKSGHSPIKRTISYSEKPVTTDHNQLLSTEPFVIVEHLFRNDFDDTEPVFVLISASMFYYNVPVTNIRSHRCRFKKWAQHWAQKETFPW